MQPAIPLTVQSPLNADGNAVTKTKSMSTETNTPFTDQEIKKAVKLYRNNPKGFHKAAIEEIITPAMDRINKSTGQENHPPYLAYLLEYSVMGGNK